jgi:hypothetical protein
MSLLRLGLGVLGDYMRYLVTRDRYVLRSAGRLLRRSLLAGLLAFFFVTAFALIPSSQNK